MRDFCRFLKPRKVYLAFLHLGAHPSPTPYRRSLTSMVRSTFPSYSPHPREGIQCPCDHESFHSGRLQLVALRPPNIFSIFCRLPPSREYNPQHTVHAIKSNIRDINTRASRCLWVDKIRTLWQGMICCCPWRVWILLNLSLWRTKMLVCIYAGISGMMHWGNFVLWILYFFRGLFLFFVVGISFLFVLSFFRFAFY